MKNLIFKPLVLLLALSSFFSCKKAVDKIQENAIFDIITNGRWVVTKFDVGTTPSLADYNGYEFQFFRNGVVTAFRSGSPDVNGTWQGNPQNLSINSNFPGAGLPLDRFNGVWFITRTTENTVDAFKTVGTQEYKLALQRL